MSQKNQKPNPSNPPGEPFPEGNEDILDPVKTKKKSPPKTKSQSDSLQGPQGGETVAGQVQKSNVGDPPKPESEQVAAIPSEISANTPSLALNLPKSLDLLPELLAQKPAMRLVLKALEQGKAATVDGAYGSSAPLVIATLDRQSPHPILVAVAHARDLDSLASDIQTFTGRPVAIFPITGSLPGDKRLDQEHRERLALLSRLRDVDAPQIILAPFAALMQPVPEPVELTQGSKPLEAGSRIEPEDLALWLVQKGYMPCEMVEKAGDFARRGGIVDIFPPDRLKPIRLEFFGDELESVREFDALTQRSAGTIGRVALLPLDTGTDDGVNFPRGNLIEHLPQGSWTVLLEPGELDEQGKVFAERMEGVLGLFDPQGVNRFLISRPNLVLSALPSPTMEQTCSLSVESVERFSGSVDRIGQELDQACGTGHVMIAVHNDAEARRLGEVLQAGKLSKAHLLHLVSGQISRGFRMPGFLEETVGLVVLGSQELFHKDAARPVAATRKLESRAIDSFLDLSEGDYVVHISHGIARYLGMKLLDKSGIKPGSAPADATASSTQAEEHLVLEFRDNVKVYVPATRIGLVEKYVGGSKADPELSRFGGNLWQKRKDKVQEAVLDLAAEMIDLQAKREATPGNSYPPDSDWQRAFEAGFGYQETPDQLAAINEIKGDMSRGRPMDRLVCGDVGYGKTELALRAAFKVADNGRQVAVLVPTTVLAEQHYKNFTRRFADFPFTVGSLNRFRTPAEVRDTLKGVSQGSIDVVIGTHRILSQDVQFKDLGLVIIDEEQRFGVEHKERLKKLKSTVDVLTLTATPIPRTLHFSLLGIRDISNLETPPPDRLAVETRIIRFDETLIKNALIRELNREGQAFFVHPRVVDIEPLAQRIRSIIPKARIVVAHGQMPEGELEAAMITFLNRGADILISTTIIESGLDIPSANTIFVNEADHFGLADLHQLRGRVGRGRNRAYAYFLLDGRKQANPQAVKRLKAIEEFAELGAGFKIALRDLEIRGAGNILGTQQSGHIASVGYELYCQLLEGAVRALKNQAPRVEIDVNIDLPWTAYLPRDYVPATKQRLEIYRRLTRIRKQDRLADFQTELTDRYGALPEPVAWLLKLAEIRLLATRWNLSAIHLDRPASPEAPIEMILTYRDPRKAQMVVSRTAGRLKLVDTSRLYFRLKKGENEPLRLYQILKDLLRA